MITHVSLLNSFNCGQKCNSVTANGADNLYLYAILCIVETQVRLMFQYVPQVCLKTFLPLFHSSILRCSLAQFQFSNQNKLFQVRPLHPGLLTFTWISSEVAVGEIGKRR